MKTAVTLLHEMMLKIGQIPEYECISQSGPQHQVMFEYKCVADGETAHGIARSKKEAKQESARGVLAALARRGRIALPPAFAALGAAAPPDAAPPPRCHVALLRELCDEYRLPAVEYSLVGDTGPPHLRQFTVRAAIGDTQRLASATTKKMARQLAAEQLYGYLRDNLRVTRDFVEEEALGRSHEKVMERYRETREDLPWRPDFGLKISEYHLGVVKQCGAGAAAARAALGGAGSAREAVQRAADALALRVETGAAGALTTLALTPTAPQLMFAGADAERAAAAAVRYLRLALEPPSPPSADLTTVIEG